MAQTIEAPSARTALGVPSLEPGDHLTLAEFERRYEAMPDVKKAELVEGVVYMPSPVSSKHARPHLVVAGWVLAYVASTPNVDALDNATVVLDADNEVQPDVMIRRSAGGASRETQKGFISGPPELVIEIAYSSAAYDVHEKRHVYRRTGVQEYIVWRVDDGALDWWKLVDGEYVPLQADADGIVRSEVFPGLCLDVPALLRGDTAAVLAGLRDAVT